MITTKQSVTTLNFDSNSPVQRGYYSRIDDENLKTAAIDESISRRFTSPSETKGLLPFCKEVAGLLIRRYLVANDPAEVRRTVSADLQKSMHCNKKSAAYLIDLALELIHLKVHGEYCRNEIELSLLISKATGTVGDLQVN